MIHFISPNKKVSIINNKTKRKIKKVHFKKSHLKTDN